MSETQREEVARLLGAIDARLANIEKLVGGNGQPGLKQKVEDLEAANNRTKGAFAVIAFIGGVLEWLLHRH